MLRSDTQDDLAFGHVKRSKQRGRAVTNVVMGDAFDVAQSHGLHRLRALPLDQEFPHDNANGWRQWGL